jgi:Spy/CpxP family protein refolding chaperone
MIRNQWLFIPTAVAMCASLAHAAPPMASHSGNAAAQKMGNGGYGSHLEAILKCVNATAEQRIKITAILNEFKPKIEPSLIKYHEKRDQFLAALTSGRSDEEIMEKQDEVGQLFSLITNEYCVMHLRVRKCLKPDQVVAYEQYRRSQGWVK